MTDLFTAAGPPPAPADQPAHAERMAWLRLARTPGIGPIRFFALLERFSTAEAAIEAAQSGKFAAEFSAQGKPLSIPSMAQAEAELALIDDADAVLITANDPGYPFRLRHIADPPPVLTVRGDAAALTQPSLAIVGARNASGNGRRFAHELARQLAEQNIVVVSGLARGIDTAAHHGVVQAGGVTIAAIASGADIAYPAENAALMADIAQTGAVISERPWGSIAKAQHFPRRNRIIAGLSVGTIVVEAALRSGSLITAKLAGDYGREIFAVPGSPLDERHRGCNRLLRDGAHFVECAADILTIAEPLLQAQTKAAPVVRKQPPRPAKPQPVSGAPAAKPATAALEKTVLDLLSPEPLPVDELIRQCHASASDVLDCLMDLEMMGQINRHAGNCVAIASS